MLLAALLLSFAPTPQEPPQEVLRDPGRGLILRRGEQEIPLGRGAFPRFDFSGDLWFERSTDDGHHLLTRQIWVIERGAITPRRARPGEVPPPPPPPATPPPGGFPRICIDPGHGGSDPGAQGFGLDEADAVLDIALGLADLLEADTLDPAGGGDWQVLLTRTDDLTVSLQERVDLANTWGAHRFVSIHANAFTSPLASGTETYCYQEATTAALMRDRVQEEMVAAWGLVDRGTKTAGFYVLVNTAMPASLSETAFITNPYDNTFLADPDQRRAMALAHLFALQRHYGLAPYEPSGPGTAGTLKGLVYDALQGTSAVIAGATVALSDGTFTTSSSSGYFEFDLPSGTYALGATAPGFAPGSSTEAVTIGDVWESLGLEPDQGPSLQVPSSLFPGAAAKLTIQADPFSPTWLAIAPRPGLPALDLGLFGWLWTDPSDTIVVGLGSVPLGGSLSVPFQAPQLSGTTLHLQALALDGGALRLSNGAAFAVL